VSTVPFIDFEVNSEDWTTCEVEDKTIVRFKTVLLGLKRDMTKMPTQLGLSLQTKLLVSTHAVPELRAKKGTVWSIQELEKHIIKPNMMYRQLKFADSIYSTKDEKIIIHTRLVQVDKTNKFGLDGEPAYLVRTEADIIVETKEGEAKPLESISLKNGDEIQKNLPPVENPPIKS
jgi:hypothetical protein